MIATLARCSGLNCTCGATGCPEVCIIYTTTKAVVYNDLVVTDKEPKRKSRAPTKFIPDSTFKRRGK